MTKELKSVDQIISDALRDELIDCLEECTPDQREFFSRIYPGGVETMAEQQLRSAVNLTHRTIRKNRASRVAA